MPGCTMDLLEIDACDAEVIPRGYPQMTAMENLRQGHAKSSNSTAVALELISEAAAAIRHFEEHSTQAVARAHDLANSIRKKLETSDMRAERAETTVAELIEAVTQAREELQVLRSQLSTKEAQLGATEERAQRAEKRADHAEQQAAEANASIERIVEAIRSQLPAKQHIGVQDLTRSGQKTIED